MLSVISFCFLISSIFSRARPAATFGALIFLASYFAYYAVNSSASARAKKTIACLSAPICLGLGASHILQFEAVGTGIGPKNGNTELYNFTFGTAIGMFIFDFIWYLLLALYLDRVIPSEWGTTEKWYFPLTTEFWLRGRSHNPQHSAAIHISNDDNPVSKLITSLSLRIILCSATQ